jgi:hypothetical protein
LYASPNLKLTRCLGIDSCEQSAHFFVLHNYNGYVCERHSERGVVTKIVPIKTEHKWTSMWSITEKSIHLKSAPAGGKHHSLYCLLD